MEKRPPWCMWLALGALVLGSLLLSFSRINEVHPPEEKEAPSAPGPSSGRSQIYTASREMEEELQNLLEKMAGVGRVAVRVSLKSGPLKEYATNTRSNSHQVKERDQGGGARVTKDNNQEAQLVMARSGQFQGGEAPGVTRETPGEVLGVVIVAEGAHDPRVRARLIQAVETLWGLAPHQIQVLPMEREGKR